MYWPIEPVSVGRQARAVLAPYRMATLIAVFERSAYVETPLGLACLGVSSLGRGPLNALLEEFPRDLALGDSIGIQVHRAVLWTPRPAPEWRAEFVAASLARLRAAASDLLPDEGLGFLLRASSPRPPAVAALEAWLREAHGDPSSGPDGAEGLIGLGPGLTPSGDDFIGGALCALHAAGQATLARRLAGWALPLAENGTNRISRAHLACAARGECSEAVHDALIALVGDEPPDLARVDAVGHTSGWDTLAGAALALASLLSLCAGTASAQNIDMREVPAGVFLMGRDDGPEDERPAHQVNLARYKIDRLPVTNAQFAQFLESRGMEGERAGRRYRRFDHDDADARIHRVAGQWRADSGLERHPVNEVTWAGARDYCEWRGGRLPTEAEWEKAARGTDARLYPWGNQAPDASRAKFNAGWTQTAPVDAHPAGASPYGALDMAGNQWEWVLSLYRPYPYNATDGREDPEAQGVRGTRGGGHDSRAEEITATQRGRNLSRAPRAGHHNIGFRCAV